MNIKSLNNLFCESIDLKKPKVLNITYFIHEMNDDTFGKKLWSYVAAKAATTAAPSSCFFQVKFISVLSSLLLLPLLREVKSFFAANEGGLEAPETCQRWRDLKINYVVSLRDSIKNLISAIKRQQASFLCQTPSSHTHHHAIIIVVISSNARKVYRKTLPFLFSLRLSSFLGRGTNIKSFSVVVVVA